jgi:hypothetical protein
MDNLVEVNRNEFAEFINLHKNLDAKPYESSSVCSMMYINDKGITIAQAIYYKGGKPIYKIRKDYKQNEDNNMQDEYGKEAIVEILMQRDLMGKDEARELIAQFEEELSEMVKEDEDKDKGFTYSLSDIEQTFEDYFGLEPDYLFCFLNDVLAKGE